MTGPDPDERFQIEGDPEDALRSLMDTGKLPEWTVSLSEAQGHVEYPEGPAADGDPGPVFRAYEWRGNAPDQEGALAQAKDAWAKHYGAPLEAASRALIKRA